MKTRSTFSWTEYGLSLYKLRKTFAFVSSEFVFWNFMHMWCKLTIGSNLVQTKCENKNQYLIDINNLKKLYHIPMYRHFYLICN